MSDFQSELRTVTLQREHRPDCPADYGTFGTLYEVDGRVIAKTCELPNAPNATGHVRVSAGRYLCRRRWSEKHQATVFGLVDVPGRSDIEIHAANWPKQLLGCIALGAAVELIEGALGVTASRDTIAAFMAAHPEDEFWIVILDAPDVAATLAAA